jgi:hypothetical protein
MSPSAAAGVSSTPHGQAVTSLATPGEAPTELPASDTEGRASVADSGVELQSKKSDKSVGDARRAAEQLEMQELQSNGVTPQDFEKVGMDQGGAKKEYLKIETRGKLDSIPFPRGYLLTHFLAQNPSPTLLKAKTFHLASKLPTKRKDKRSRHRFLRLRR